MSKKKPTIEELEDILNSNEEMPYEILPDGSIKTINQNEEDDMSENKKDIKITLFSNYILIDMMKKKKTSKLITPETIKQPLTSDNFDAVVVKVSQEEDMIKNVKVGDIVCLSANSLHTGQVMKIQGKQYFIVRETEVVGIFHKGYDEEDKELKVVIPPDEAVN